MSLSTIAVIGANIAGLRAVEALRRDGYDRRIVLISSERHLPYDRPPLSKEFLKGEVDVGQLLYHDEAWYRDQGVEVMLGTSATGLDVRGRRILHSGGSTPYDGAIIATGSRARTIRLPEPPAGLSVVRTIDDAVELRDRLKPGCRTVIVGAGFIGAEVASSARAVGAEVTVLEGAETPLTRALGRMMGGALGRLHGENGATLRCGATVVDVTGRGRVEFVHLSDGTRIPADVVVAGIGVTPNADWLNGSGLTLIDGVATDHFLNAGPENVFAAGDVVSVHNSWLGWHCRGEQWTTASDQGQLAAHNLLKGRAEGKMYTGAPYFWSDQYGVKIQSAGHTAGDEVLSLLGTPSEWPFVGAYVRDGRAIGVVAINAPRQFARARKALAAKPCLDEIKNVVMPR